MPLQMLRRFTLYFFNAFNIKWFAAFRFFI